MVPFVKDRPKGERPPIDVLLATNMIAVGVDVPRLGMMVVANQPKSTAEYVQATSRIGRRAPGLVFTVFNWARPRDLSHYETFEHFHATIYRQVEALSVTPVRRPGRGPRPDRRSCRPGPQSRRRLQRQHAGRQPSTGTTSSPTTSCATSSGGPATSPATTR